MNRGHHGGREPVLYDGHFVKAAKTPGHPLNKLARQQGIPPEEVGDFLRAEKDRYESRGMESPWAQIVKETARADGWDEELLAFRGGDGRGGRRGHGERGGRNGHGRPPGPSEINGCGHPFCKSRVCGHGAQAAGPAPRGGGRRHAPPEADLYDDYGDDFDDYGDEDYMFENQAEYDEGFKRVHAQVKATHQKGRGERPQPTETTESEKDPYEAMKVAERQEQARAERRYQAEMHQAHVQRKQMAGMGGMGGMGGGMGRRMGRGGRF
ncbi:MAG: hypothetical protein L6R38_008745 [Xanthoria sp. 2 TBL-2021]|nr:MAG: hypothetical protein L6R38_008745 [Xanthoria sp. 2 TBL-2021]